jgi:integrase
VVRSLGRRPDHHARFTAAAFGYALAEAIVALRHGDGDMDAKKLIDSALSAAARGEVRPYELTIPGVVSLKADGPEDHARALESIGLLSELFPHLKVHPAPATALPALPAGPAGPMLHAAIDRFVKTFGASGRAPATVEETEHTLSLFRDLIDDCPVSEVGTEHVDRFRDALALWPARARVMGEFKGLNAREVIEKAQGRGMPGLSVRTVDKHLDRLRVFFNALVKRRELTHNPLADVRLQTSAAKYVPKRRGFEPHELAALFDPERRKQHTDGDALFYWVPLLMLYTGARRDEIVFLDASDLEEIQGCWGIHITKRLKNPQSRRFVPLPQCVLDLGLREHADAMKAAGSKRLFPGGAKASDDGQGKRVSKWFNRTYLKACGIEDAAVCLQSFRNTLLTAADRLGISEAQIGPIVGHGPRTMQQKHYIDLPTLCERRQRIERIAGCFLAALPVFDANDPDSAQTTVLSRASDKLGAYVSVA